MIDLKKIKNDKSIQELLEFGIININKPSGPTSFDVSEFVKKTLKLKKTSHFGTLDPKVTGVLPVALSRACKLTGFFLGEDKEYVGIMRIHKEIPIEKIKKAIEEKFTGKITQIPPVKSRVKRQERQREIKKFEILEKDGKDVLFRAEVEGGTYIRKLIDDLGKYFKVGAHMLELRRVRAGIFREETSVNLYDFEKAVEEYKKGNEKLLREMIIPGEIISQIYPVVPIKEEAAEKILHGRPIFHEDIIEGPEIKEGNFAGFVRDKLIGIFKIINTQKIYAKPEFVLQPIK